MKLTITSPKYNLAFETKKRETTIGRINGNDWVVHSEALSRTHCIVYDLGDRGAAIMDPGSKNGVVVDGVRLPPEKMVPINHSSIIMLANELYLTLLTDKARKVEMIEPLNRDPRPKPSSNPRARSESQSKARNTGQATTPKKIVIIMVLLLLILCAVFILYRK